MQPQPPRDEAGKACDIFATRRTDMISHIKGRESRSLCRSFADECIDECSSEELAVAWNCAGDPDADLHPKPLTHWAVKGHSWALIQRPPADVRLQLPPGVMSSGFNSCWNDSVTPARFKWSVSK